MKVWKKRDEEVNTIEEYFLKKHDGETSDKRYKICNLKEAANLIEQNKNNLFYIIGDYDVDGIAATAIMELGLKRKGCRVMHRIPKRISEGYGISQSLIEEIPAGAVIITVDNGISAVKEIQQLKENGHTVIVTDHHLPGEELPYADIIVNPHVTGGDFTGYCGAGIAYRLITELLQEELPLLTVYAAIATVADVMDLVKENHFIVKKGLHYMNNKKDVLENGIKALLEILGKEKISSYDIAFGIAPMLNAPGRLEDDGAEKALQLLLTHNIQSAYEQALVLNEINEERKEALRKALTKVESKDLETTPIMIYLPNEEEGIIGLVAARLQEENRKPTIVFTDSEDGLKGSARSVPQVHMKQLLDAHQEFLIRYGGHAGAAGMSMKKDDFPAFKKSLQEALKDFIPSNEAWYDLELKKGEEACIYQTIEEHTPFGKGNEEPVFLVKDVDMTNIRYMGDAGQHAKIQSDGLEIMAFNGSEKIKAITTKKADFYGRLKKSEFRGQTTYQIIIQ